MLSFIPRYLIWAIAFPLYTNNTRLVAKLSPLFPEKANRPGLWGTDTRHGERFAKKKEKTGLLSPSPTAKVRKWRRAENARTSSVFPPLPPLRQLENWREVVYFPRMQVFVGLGDQLAEWEASKIRSSNTRPFEQRRPRDLAFWLHLSPRSWFCCAWAGIVKYNWKLAKP